MWENIMCVCVPMLLDIFNENINKINGKFQTIQANNKKFSVLHKIRKQLIFCYTWAVLYTLKVLIQGSIFNALQQLMAYFNTDV